MFSMRRQYRSWFPLLIANKEESFPPLGYAEIRSIQNLFRHLIPQLLQTPEEAAVSHPIPHATDIFYHDPPWRQRFSEPQNLKRSLPAFLRFPTRTSC